MGDDGALTVGPPRIDVRGSRRVLTAPVRLGAVREELRVAFDAALPVPSRAGDALLLWFILAAMRRGVPLAVEAEVSPELTAGVERAQRIWTNLPAYDGLRRVPVRAQPAAGPARAPHGRPWLSAFSGGVDAFYTALKHRDRLGGLLYLHGIDAETPDPAHIERDRAWLRPAAAALGLPLVEVETNLRRVLVGALGSRWDEVFSIAPYGMAHLLGGAFEKLVIGGELSYGELQRLRVGTKYHPALDRPLSSAAVAVAVDGMECARHEKIAALARRPGILPHLRVCAAHLTEGYAGARNCGQCEKCLRTMAAFRIAGALDAAAPAFDRPFDLAALAAVRIPVSRVAEIRMMYHLGMLEHLEQTGADPALRAALAAAVAGSPDAHPAGLAGLSPAEKARAPRRVTFQPPAGPEARLRVAAPAVGRSPRGDWTYAFSVLLDRPSGPSQLLGRVGFTSSVPVTLPSGPGNPALAATLLPAMALGIPLTVEAPVSPRLLAGLDRFQDCFVQWFDGYRKVPVEAPPADPPPTPPAVGPGLFFSSGVDAFFSLKRHLDERPALIYLDGFDVPPARLAHRDMMARHAASIAAELGLALITVQTDVRGFGDAYAWWGQYCGSVLGAAALLLEGTCSRVYVGASNTYACFLPFGTNPVTDECFSAGGLGLVHDGADAARLDKVRALAGWDYALRRLRVCWNTEGRLANCCRCEKCLRTMTGLWLADALDRAPTFPEPLDPARIAACRVTAEHAWLIGENVRCAAETGRADAPVIRAWQDALERARAGGTLDNGPGHGQKRWP